MMPSASPKQRVLIVGAKFGEMYLNAFMQPPEGLELVGLLAQGSALKFMIRNLFISIDIAFLLLCSSCNQQYLCVYLHQR